MSADDQKMMADPGWPFLRLTREEMAKIQQRPYDSKKNVWVNDPEEGYIAGEITGTKTDAKLGEMVTVITAKGSEVCVKREQAQEMNPPKFDKTEDMANLTFLNDASVLGNLRSRYASLLIYTYSGLFCVVVNPYKRLPIYTDTVARYYMGKRRNEMPPHLYSVSDEAYRNMLQDHGNQSMLITGESGAGKTENTKKVIGYFATVGASQKEAELAKAGKEVAQEKIITLEDQIVQTNPVLEAFGNAKTVRNNNSSRFGKFIRIMFNKAGKVASCDIDHYLLEKSRVIRQAPGERCFHIFYQIFSGFKPELVKELQLDKPIKEYWYMAQAELTIDGVNDKEEHQLTEEAFDTLLFTPEEKKNAYQILSGMQHTGIMKFKQSPRGEQAEPDGTDEAAKAAAMFGVNVEEFLKALCSPRVRVGNEWVNKGQNVDQVSWACGAISKAMYSRMFHWIVMKCNETLDQKGLSRDYFIGVLDIAGFEIFDFNSFEQLWINFVNEKLQQFFNHHMFVLEQEEYKREGIQWTFIDFGLDLQACIELIEKPLGIISMLDEECIVPKATDLTLVEKLCNQHLGKHPNFVKPPPPKGKQAEAHFAMKHYAGLVRYNCLNWLEKNKDPLNDSLVTALKRSKENKLLNTIWESYITQEEQAEMAKEGGRGKGGKSGSFLTVSMMYRESLNRLMTMLQSTHPHFIRCIIPNEKKQCGLIEASLVLNQLTCNGVLEGIRICRKGFPNRTLHEDFKQRYAILASTEAKNAGSDEKKAAEAIMQALINRGDMNEEQFRIGHTKVFFKAGVLAHLEDLRDERLGQVMMGFQARCRWFCQQAEKRRLMQQKRGLLILHRNIRTWTVVRTWDWFLLFGKLRPQLKVGKEGEEIDKLTQKIKELEENLQIEESQRKKLEDAASKLVEEKNKVFKELEDVKTLFSDLDSRLQAINAQKKDLEKQVNELSDRLGEQEDRNADINRGKKKVEGECDNLRKKIEDLEGNLRKTESEKDAKDQQIRSLQDEMAQLDETIAKLNKEKKQQEEINRKLMEDVQAEEDKSGATNKLKQKIEKLLDDLEDQLEREKRARNDLEKQKRKVEGELRIAEEALEEGVKQRGETENNLKKKESELQALTARLDEEQGLVGKLQRQLKELQAKIGELEEELEAEHQGRTKADRLKSDLQRELDELSERLDEQGGMTAAQIEVNKKREAELAKIRRELEEQNMNHENQLGALRKKHTDSVGQLSEQIDEVQKSKAKAEKDRAQAQREFDDLQSQLDSETSSKLNNEKLVKQFELQVAELQTKVDEQTRQLQELTSLKSRMTAENTDMNRQLEEIESQINNLGRVKNQLTSQLEEARRTADEEARDKNQAAAQAKNYQHEAEQLREQIDEEIEGKNEALRNLSKANAEIQQWKTRLEGEDLLKSDEIDDAKRRQQQKLNELQEALDAASSKVASLEKTRSRLQTDLDDAQVDVERANGYAKQLEQKQKGFDKIAGEWKKKTDDLLLDIDSAQRDNRNLSTDLFKMKNTHDELLESIEGLRRENKGLTQEIRDLMDALGEGGRSVQELQQAIRHVELEKEELQRALDEAEAALEAEESKVLRAQVEVSQIRAEIEKRIQEKEEEFENTRRNHQRALDSMQASLENETKGKAELLRIKKKLESDINELEVALDHANRANADAQKNIRLYGDQIRELQQQIEIEQRNRDEIREQYLNMEKRATLLQSEKEEITVALEQADRARKAAEREAHECHEKVNELGGSASSLSGAKKKLEAELQAIQADLDETLNEYHASEERSKKAAADAGRLAEELRQEQENANQVERLRKALELQLKDMQTRLDEAEAAALKGGKKVIEKLEKRIHDLELELDSEQRRNQDVNKNIAKQDRRVRELQFQIDEDKKNFERMQDLVDKLQNKLKSQKKQIEEAEEVANLNLQKYRQLQHQLEDAEERADLAENSLSKMRAKSRSAASVAPGGGLQSSQSAAVVRAPSRSNF